MRSDPVTPRGQGRRRLLAAAALALPFLAAGCKGIGGLGTPPRPLPDVAVLTDAIASEKLLIARYEAVFATSPTLAGPLASLLAQHRAHLARLRGRLAESRASTAPHRKATHPPVPGTPPAAVAYLRDSEHAATVALLSHLDLAPPSLAQLLASIAASEATHAAMLAARGRAG